MCGLAILVTAVPGAGAVAADDRPSQREVVLRAMRDRPGDPWPRGRAHVVLAVPGSPQGEKGYHEPGGSLSPSVGSFGVSIWVRDAAGTLRTTSDAIPLERVSQRLTWPDPRGIPALETVTPEYRATWSCRDNGEMELSLEPRGDGTRLELAVRSVGPAGGPITRIGFDAGELKVNDRWSARVEPAPAAITIGHEGDPGWKDGGSDSKRWEGRDGWGFARLRLEPGRPVRLTVRDLSGRRPSPLRYPGVRSALELDLPDSRFRECLDAQVAHLMMGLLDRRTPPGEPTNYPLAWQRDGATVVAGLVRAGQVGLARELAAYFAEVDFFGGFGSEGDAPGQALRVMEDVAARVRDPGFDAWLWPHAVRKAELILRMASTDRPIRMPYAGPIVPDRRKLGDLDLVCEPARDGRIIGRMDFGRPVSYVTGVSLRGLYSAAALARRLKHEDEARRWLDAAASLRRAWLRDPQWGEDRTYISGLWPTWAAADIKAEFQRHLETRSDPARYLPWTYFGAAVTHQWLPLNRPDRVWENLAWYWDHQTSPGLFTWWEGEGEENTFHLWEEVRGWVQPAHVTPHYWTAAEILALQAEMLAFVDESGPEPVLVIGGGIPASWVGSPMSVRGLPTSLGVVNWSWKDGKMDVSVSGSKPAIRLGPSFAAARR